MQTPAMLRAALLSLVASLLGPALAAQVPLAAGNRWQDPTEWRVEKPPNPNDTDHLVFETVHSLLQHWPNTRMRNGHNIVPAVIPQGTLLYHGTNITELPPGPEWAATDPEHSYLFCQPDFQLFAPVKGESGCWHVTLAATRPLKVVYFDGSSAAKMPYGSMDTQDLLAWGEANPDGMWDELRLINDLCDWGKSFGVDGFVRMEMDFEVMLCDFTAGLRVVSWTNVACFNMTPPFWPTFSVFEVMNSGSWHNRFPGETRIQPDLAGIVSFYDTQLVPSLVPTRVGQERWDHRVADVSSQDLSALKSRLETSLVRPSGASSGIDWKTLIQVVVDRYAGRLELTRHLLNSPVSSADQLVTLSKRIQTQLRIMLTPYLVFTAAPSDGTTLDWAAPIYRECATPHTKFVKSELDAMTDSEKLLLQAVRGTSREICRVVTKTWAAGVHAGLDSSLNTRESLSVAEVAQVWTDWAKDLNRLTEWLDWSVWVKCEPECGPEEICYLPTWPIGFPYSPLPPMDDAQLADSGRPRETLTSFELRTMVRQIIAKEMSDVAKPEPDEWIRPQPKCLKRVEPYEF